jgi:hypothetical protein
MLRMDENLQNNFKSAAHKRMKKIKRRERRKYLKVWGDQIINSSRETFRKKWLASEKLEDIKKTNTILVGGEVRK